MGKEEMDLLQKVLDKNKQMSQEEQNTAEKQFKNLLHGSPKTRMVKGLKDLITALIFLFIAWLYLSAFSEGNIENMRFIGFISIPFIIAGGYFFWQNFNKN